jgi:hypothetical protein
MLPSLFAADNETRPWSALRAGLYGAGIGAVAALFKTFGPLREAGLSSSRVLEVAGVAAVFALLCAAAAVLRNFVTRRLIWPKRT